MLKPVDPTAATRPQRQPLPQEAINNVFRVLHGFYGNLFTSKFSSGVLVDVDVEVEGGGRRKVQMDQGMVGAREIWAYGLRDYDAGAVKAALAQCMQRHPEYPPSLPQFAALCSANTIRQTHEGGPLRIGMSQELGSEYVRRAREALEQHRESIIARKVGYIELPQTLDGLKRAIANAVATAGGDEARELLRLDRMLAPRGAV